MKHKMEHKIEHNTEQYLTIGEVSRLLSIPESTLRFWQEKGIFQIPKGRNNYRMYTVEDLIRIAEIAFYRSIGIPVKEMEQFGRFSLTDYDNILKSVGTALEEKLSTYRSMYQAAALKTEHLQSIRTLKDAGYFYGKVPFHTVVRFEYSDRDKLLCYTKNPSLYVRYMKTTDLEHDIRGMMVEEVRPSDTLLWQKKGDTDYAVFLIEENASENYSSNICTQLEQIQQKHRTGHLFANFLMSEMSDGKRIDYLRGYVQLLS